MIRLEGKIVDADSAWLTIRVPYNPEYVQKNMQDAVVFLPDGRKHSIDQHGKVWALIGEIALWAGFMPHDSSQVNALMKRDFLLKRFDQLSVAAIKTFSMSDVDVSTASLYIDYLVDFVLENSIPTKRPVTELCEDIQQTVYAAMMHKRCIVCGRKATLHHVDRVGMGNDRREICHIGMRALPLCWGVDGHHNEAHRIGDAALCEKYHLEPVVIDEKIAKKYNLNREEK
nr:hypothetical protein [Clostridia bacterium]